jgi:hypothetical protein
LAVGDRLHKTSDEQRDVLELLAISFQGRYVNDGSDSVFMEGVIQWSLLAWEAHGLVLDFRDLAYEWGDRMQRVLDIAVAWHGSAEQHLVRQLFNPRDPSVFPTAVIISDKCRAGLESLVREEMDGRVGSLVQTEEEAIAYIVLQWSDRGPD